MFVPQADLLSFQPSLLFLPVVFLVGYFFFVTRWVPRILFTFKARAWLTRYHRTALLVGFTSPEGWPELALMAVQFAGLVWVVTRVTLVAHPEGGLAPLGWIPPPAVTLATAGSAPVENFFTLWAARRGGFLFAAAAGELTTRVDRVLGGFGFFAAPKQFPLVALKLRTTTARLSGRLPREGV